MEKTIHICDRCKQERKIYEVGMQTTQTQERVELCSDCALVELRLVLGFMTLENQDKWRQRVLREGEQEKSA